MISEQILPKTSIWTTASALPASLVAMHEYSPTCDCRSRGISNRFPFNEIRAPKLNL